MTHAGSLPQFAVITIDEARAFVALPKSAQTAVIAVRMYADPRNPLDPDRGCRRSVRQLAEVMGVSMRSMERGLAAASDAGWLRKLDDGDPARGRPASRSVLSPDPHPPSKRSAEHPDPRQNQREPPVSSVGAPPSKRSGDLKEADPVSDPVSDPAAVTAENARLHRANGEQRSLLDAGEEAASKPDDLLELAKRVDRAIYEARKVAKPDRKTRIGKTAQGKAGLARLRGILEFATGDELLDAIERLGRYSRDNPTYIASGRERSTYALIKLDHMFWADGRNLRRYLDDPTLDKDAGKRSVPSALYVLPDPTPETGGIEPGELDRMFSERGWTV